LAYDSAFSLIFLVEWCEFSMAHFKEKVFDDMLRHDVVEIAPVA
jgi:hypothetical protein